MNTLALKSSILFCIPIFLTLGLAKEVVPELLIGLDSKMGLQERVPLWHPLLRDDA